MLALSCLGLLVAGCQAGLMPAPEAQLVPNRRHAAVAESHGVRIVAETDAWHGSPSDLEGLVVPLLVTIENLGPVPVRLRYDAFTLVGADGRRYPARSPFDIRGVVSEPVPYGAYPDWGDAPYLGPYHPGWWAGGPWPRSWYYDRYWPYYYSYPPYRRVALPTPDMVQTALPERVLQPGERVTGFLFFDGVPTRVPRADFVADLVDARTAAPFGTVAIPFVMG
jgi:hypothetical protein